MGSKFHTTKRPPHLIIDQSAAKRKLKKLRRITQTDLAILNSAEPYRVSSYVIFKRNLLDPCLYLCVATVYFLCKLLTRHSNDNLLSFVVLFAFLFYTINHHIESYRSFVLVNRSVRRLTRSHELMMRFLSTHLADGGGAGRAEREEKADSFVWINKIIVFFWPLLSEVIHQKLDEFFRSGSSMARAIISDVLVIEKCQLGHQTPMIKKLAVVESSSAQPESAPSKRMLVYNMNLVYNGDMVISILYRYLCCCASRVGLKDVFLHFKLQVAAGPLPNIEQVSFTLLELPDFGYKGIALAELAELRMVRKLINRIIRDHLLHPRKVTLNLRELSESSKRRANKTVGGQSAAEQRQPPGGETTLPSNVTSRVGFWKRIQTDALICGCMSANFLLRCCQCLEHRNYNNNAAKSTSSK